MRFLLLLFGVWTFSAIASDSPEVPEPIPPDFNQCVRMFITDEGRENGVTGKIRRLDPPLTREDHAYLEYWRREGWATLKLCGDSEQS